MGHAWLKPALVAAVTGLVAVTAATVPGSPDADVAAAPVPPAAAVFHPVVREAAARTGDYAAEYTVYRPADLDRVRGRLPVVVFGNGACRHTSNDELLTLETLLAAHGFVVVAVGGFDEPALTENGSPEPEVLLDAITWADRENGRRGSELRNKLDVHRIGVTGHSCGGIQALVTVPAVRVTNPAAGHTGFVYGQRDGNPDPSVREEAVRVLVDWFDFTLNGNRTARGSFLGAGCGLCATPGWTVTAKNF